MLVDSFQLLRARIRVQLSRPERLHSIVDSRWDIEIPALPEESLEFHHLSRALESSECMYYLPTVLDFCRKQPELPSVLIGKAVIAFSNPRKHRPFDTYALFLKSLEDMFVSATSRFTRSGSENQYWKCGKTPILLSPVANCHERDSFLKSICRREVAHGEMWFFDCLLSAWANDDAPDRAAHLMDFLYQALTFWFPVELECYREPAVIRLLIDAKFCHRVWSSAGDFFRTVVGDEYADAVQQALVDDRPAWLQRAGDITIRDSVPRIGEFFFKQTEVLEIERTMPKSPSAKSYVEAIRCRDELFHEVRMLTARADSAIRRLKDCDWRGTRAYGISDRHASTPEFPQGPALFDVSDWPAAETLKQAFEELNAANEAVFASWNALSDEVRQELPLPSYVWPANSRRKKKDGDAAATN